MAGVVALPGLYGWDLVSSYVTPVEPPPIPEGRWSASEVQPSGWVHVECNTTDPIRYKTLGGAFGLHPKRNLEVARMWAAAPDMMAALEDLLDYDGGADHGLADQYVVERARAALARARGEQ